jgi:ribosome-binding protein aMBF1 (putative translation factor)
MTRRGETTSYIGYSIDEIFHRKIEALCCKIRDFIYCGTVYTTSQHYCCKFCHCRIMVRGNEKCYCLSCQTVPFWSETTRTLVAQILQSYPTLAECRKERRSHTIPSKHITTEKVAYGSHIEEMRMGIGWSRACLAARIAKRQGGTISTATIIAIEKGVQNPSPYVREQLDHLFCCGRCQNNQRCEAWQDILGLKEMKC